MERIEPHRALGVSDADIRPSEEGLAERELDQEFGVVRTERMRAVEIPGRPLEVASVEMDAPEHQVQRRVSVVERQSLMRALVGGPGSFLEAVPELATPFIEPGERQAGMGARRLRIKLERRAEELACSLVGRQRSLAQKRHPLNDQRIDRQPLGSPTSLRERERLQLGV